MLHKIAIFRKRSDGFCCEMNPCMLQKQRKNYPSTMYTQPHDRIALLVHTQ